MIVHAWRITRAQFAAGAFSGEGAKEAGGRWNLPGIPLVYTAASQSLAILEMLVHLHAPDLLKRYVLFPVQFDEALAQTLDHRSLPRNWRKFPAPDSVRQIGSDWAADFSSAVLRVPSVIVPLEWNYLFNPAHPALSKIVIGPKQPVQFDPRLIKTSGR